VNGALILHDGRILSWAGDGSLRLWDEKNGAPVARWAGHVGRVTSVYLLGTRRVLSRDHHGAICLWDLATGALLHKGDGFRPQMLPHGRLLTVTAEGAVDVWAADGAEPIRLSMPSDWQREAIDEDSIRTASRAWVEQHSLHDACAVWKSTSTGAVLRARPRGRSCAVVLPGARRRKP
jgi:WD40 repeat protein